jgi:anti-sigma factor RsiW
VVCRQGRFRAFRTALSDQGFSLVGGRIDYLDNRAIVTILYQRRKHFINLLIWPLTEGTEAAPKATTRQGYNLFHWRHSGMTYWAVSDLNPPSWKSSFTRFKKELDDAGLTPPLQPNPKRFPGG